MRVCPPTWHAQLLRWFLLLIVSGTLVAWQAPRANPQLPESETAEQETSAGGETLAQKSEGETGGGWGPDAPGACGALPFRFSPFVVFRPAESATRPVDSRPARAALALYLLFGALKVGGCR